MIKKILVALALALVPIALAQLPAFEDWTRDLGGAVGRTTYGVELTTFLNGYTDYIVTNQYASLFAWSYYGALIALGLYYLVIDESRYRDAKYWVMWLTLGALPPAIKAFIVAQDGRSNVPDLADIGVGGPLMLAFLTFVLACLLGFLLTFALRPVSQNCSKTPFR